MSSTNVERVSTTNRAFQEEVDLHEEQQSPRFLRTDDRDAAGRRADRHMPLLGPGRPGKDLIDAV